MCGNFVEIWHGDILLKESEEQDYWPLLSENEKEKANAFTRSDLQKKYIKTRGVLRKTLASYLKIEPQNIIIKIGKYGKPYLEASSVYFNLSHTGNKFAVVVCNFSDVGIDVERYRARKNLSALVKKCFSEEESLYWHSLPERQKIQMFYRFWVRKEAFVKAVGRGLALGLEQCIINSDNHTLFSSVPEIYGLASEWKIVDVPLGSNDVCAVVIKNQEFKYKQKKW